MPVKPSSKQRLQRARQRVQEARQAARQRVNLFGAALRAVPGDQYAAALAGLLAVVVMLSGIHAHEPGTWLLENTPVALGLLFLGWSYRVMPLSRVSYSLIFLFLCLHETGAHWTYAKVPYDDWWRSLTGHSLNS